MDLATGPPPRRVGRRAGFGIEARIARIVMTSRAKPIDPLVDLSFRPSGQEALSGFSWRERVETPTPINSATCGLRECFSRRDPIASSRLIFGSLLARPRTADLT